MEVNGVAYNRYDSLALALKDTAALAQNKGRPVSPRGMLTHELPHHTVIINPYDTLCTGIGRGMNVKFAAVEALEVIGGVSATKLKIEVNPNAANFMNDGDFRGAYGPRIGPVLPRVVETLQRDPASRQAVLTIFDSKHDLFLPADTRDYPCTAFLQFLLRDDFLELHTYMRSNDIWWGLTYDAFVFTQLQHTVAWLLDSAVGDYFHTATSMHLYERDFDKWCDLKSEATYDYHPLGIVASLSNKIDDVMWTARAILTGSSINTGPVTNAWYWNALWSRSK